MKTDTMNQENYEAALEHFQSNRYGRAAQEIDADIDMARGLNQDKERKNGDKE